MAESEFNCMRFDDSMVVDPDECIYQGDYNPHNVRPWLIRAYGIAICVVFAENSQEALDEAADEEKLEKYKIPDDVAAKASKEEYDEYIHLGNDSAPYDMEGLEVIELPIPKRSFCAQFNESQS